MIRSSFHANFGPKGGRLTGADAWGIVIVRVVPRALRKIYATDSNICVCWIQRSESTER
jgi:hypothetical protein